MRNGFFIVFHLFAGLVKLPDGLGQFPQWNDAVYTLQNRHGLGKQGVGHSYGSCFGKVCQDPGAVVTGMGARLKKFQDHYGNKGSYSYNL